LDADKRGFARVKKSRNIIRLIREIPLWSALIRVKEFLQDEQRHYMSKQTA